MFLSRDDVPEQNASPSWPEVVLATVATALTSFDAILCGMVAAGLGIDALSLYLGLTRTGLLDRVAALGLPTPHDRPMRRAGGKTPWSAEDVRLLIAAWTEGAHVLNIAEALGRSRGAIYSKRRRLGLPSRDRQPRQRLSNAESREPALAWHGEIAGEPDLFSTDPRPAQAFETPRAPTSTYRAPSARRAAREETVDLWENSDAVGLASPASAEAGNVLEALREGFETPTTWPDFGELSVWDAPALPETEQKKSRRISIRKLSAEQKAEIEDRGLAGQRPKAIARDMGVTECQVTSHLWRSEVAVIRTEFGVILVDAYDPPVAVENVRAWRLEKRPPWKHGDNDKLRQPYWRVRGRHNLPRFYTQSKSFKGLP